MATRRASTRTPAALREGRTYNSVLPRQAMRINRAVTLQGAQYQQQYTITEGQPVATGEPVRTPKQPLVPGSIVQLSNQRRSYPDRSEIESIYRGAVIPQYAANAGLWVVVAVDAQRKFMTVTPLWTSNSSRCTVSVSPVVTFTYKQSYYDDARTLTTLSDFAGATRTSIAKTPIPLDETASLARCRHVIAVIDPSQLPAGLIEAIQKQARDAVAEQMFARLAGMVLTPGTPRRDRRAYMPYNRKRRQEVGRNIAEALYRARKLWGDSNEQACAELNRAYVAITRSVAASSRAVENAEQRATHAVERWAQRAGFGHVTRARGCGHFHTGESVELVSTGYGSRDWYCPECAAFAVTVTVDDGEVRASRSVTTYAWSDGTRRLTREPGIIGPRHSGKGIVGFVEPLLKRPRGAYLTLGLELEMQAYNGHTRDDMARAMRQQMVQSNLLDASALRRYMHFEEDGSTGPGGFEMVTGYTDLATQDKLLATLLCNSDGAPAWAGRLRSHDASGEACGIHVHITKPKHLVHASKMKFFINNSVNSALIRDVARRYNGIFARIENPTIPPQQDAAGMLKSAKGHSTKATPMHQTLALSRINHASRYQALNFQNTATVEFRIFRGSMLHETVVACLEFTQAVWWFTKYTSAVNLVADKFIAFINERENRHATKHLRSYLKRRGYDVFLPKPAKNTDVADIQAALESIS